MEPADSKPPQPISTSRRQHAMDDGELAKCYMGRGAVQPREFIEVGFPESPAQHAHNQERDASQIYRPAESGRSSDPSHSRPWLPRKWSMILIRLWKAWRSALISGSSSCAALGEKTAERLVIFER
ncbi:hypothetical protein F7725_007407 [Dissostichus mawsoni]|uniref:Uncharacterized protein n=1 Tax=Dissostichus mawsoni TaxID=36200 RepID=A0A7J5XWP9_DISMA|nr:hypothetical protein F7725_007407 [Dissostichus mawsoni]